jgi:hypothetical protein
VLKPPGVAVPIHINPKTGFIAVDAVIDGKRYAMPIDNGSAYTGIRRSDDPSGTVLLILHPAQALRSGTRIKALQAALALSSLSFTGPSAPRRLGTTWATFAFLFSRLMRV